MDTSSEKKVNVSSDGLLSKKADQCCTEISVVDQYCSQWNNHYTDHVILPCFSHSGHRYIIRRDGYSREVGNEVSYEMSIILISCDVFVVQAKNTLS